MIRVASYFGNADLGQTLEDYSANIEQSTFSQVQLHGRLRRYRLPLHVCQLIHDLLVVDEVTGEVWFRDYVEDDKRMAILFEEFVCNFYRRELHGWKVRGSEKIAWDLVPLTSGWVAEPEESRPRHDRALALDSAHGRSEQGARRGVGSSGARASPDRWRPVAERRP